MTTPSTTPRPAVRTHALDKGALASWAPQTRRTAKKSYSHRLLLQSARLQAAALEELQHYVDDALADALREVRLKDDSSISPFKDDTRAAGELTGFPGRLPEKTLLGYLGEILAGAVAEGLTIHGLDDWTVPAFFFRFHNDAFHYLENDQMASAVSREVAGRHGDDVVAFHFDGKGQLDGVLVAEAKCLLAGHRSNKAEEAHQQLSGKGIPPGLRDMERILREYKSDPKAQRARRAIAKLLKGQDASKIPRRDLLMYVTSDSPVRPPTRKTWIDENAPATHYSGARPLEVVEVHSAHLAELMADLLRRA